MPSLKGLGHQMDIFCRPSNLIRSVLSEHAPGLLNLKINVKFLFASLKTLTNSKDCYVSRIKFMFRLSFTLIG
jgi:hypothetical protein